LTIRTKKKTLLKVPGQARYPGEVRGRGKFGDVVDKRDKKINPTALGVSGSS